MTKFHFVTYGVIHAGDRNEAKRFLKEAVKEGQFEYFDVVVEELDTWGLNRMGCKNICETFPSVGRTDYFTGNRYCSKCCKFLWCEGIYCLCCSSMLRSSPYDKREKVKRKVV